jgi:hypothetical protein
MRTRILLTAAALAAPIALAQPALAASAPKFGDPIKVSDTVTFDPIIDARLRWEHVDQPNIDADAVTLRLRAGAELKDGGLSLLVEGEGTLAIDNHYNAFPFAVAVGQRRPQYSTIADPENVELNRAQLQYKGTAATVTIGRQRINLDDQRWVGNAGWRQNEQTFDAIRGEFKVGPVSLDGTYAISQRTIYGIDAGTAKDFVPGTGPRQHYSGDFYFVGAGAKLGPVNLKGFAYLLDYDPITFVRPSSSQTYGARATAAFPLAPKLKLNLAASYARQSDYGSNPVAYAADYVAGEAGLAYKALTLTAGYELLGSDASAAGGASRAVQTPMATLHKFNGWADVFLTTPNKGLQDVYLGAAYKFDGIKALPGLNAAVIWHGFDSDAGNLDYGDEWDASLGFKIGRVALLGKYANYRRHGAQDFATDVNTEKFWLQAEIAF